MEFVGVDLEKVNMSIFRSTLLALKTARDKHARDPGQRKKKRNGATGRSVKRGKESDEPNAKRIVFLGQKIFGAVPRKENRKRGGQNRTKKYTLENVSDGCCMKAECKTGSWGECRRSSATKNL